MSSSTQMPSWVFDDDHEFFTVVLNPVDLAFFDVNGITGRDFPYGVVQGEFAGAVNDHPMLGARVVFLK